MKQRIKGRVSKEGFYFESLRGGQTFSVREGGPQGRFIGHVTRLSQGWWRAHLPGGITAKGQSRSQAVLKAMKTQGEGETA
ncbi:hypothetical protein [Lihuaxuella thermophila]|uniref:Uncharacterized protein n=1 Tax=Lihuaxuella thermophila TaxID=1173111 RepID=A0A1H8HAW3_9BACL|nr:hypothetical protein [Lihuaxuella thermophila]SEN53366.1 hypothetical protein SAMN05444955_113123 [Lihuaxuella thermophila]SEN78217.1 hypothetical protein SAMN05444955_12336 [Lihuaxuella thermophila]SEN80340.1 hypothetical protein SAMN05444955_1266 [Lihuaxuella thermophila]